MIRVCICDDFDASRKETKLLLSTNKSIKIISETNNGNHLLTELNNGIKPDLVIIDIQMPNMNGYEVCHKIRQKFPKQDILCYSGHLNKNIILKILLNGAKGYVAKTTGPELLLNAVVHIVNHHSIFENQWVTSTIIAELNSYKKIQHANSSILDITSRETEILRKLNDGLTYAEIAVLLTISEHTVKSHCENIYKKMQVTNKKAALKLATNHALIP